MADEMKQNGVFSPVCFVSSLEMDSILTTMNEKESGKYERS